MGGGQLGGEGLGRGRSQHNKVTPKHKVKKPKSRQGLQRGAKPVLYLCMCQSTTVKTAILIGIAGMIPV